MLLGILWLPRNACLYSFRSHWSGVRIPPGAPPAIGQCVGRPRCRSAFVDRTQGPCASVACSDSGEIRRCIESPSRPNESDSLDQWPYLAVRDEKACRDIPGTPRRGMTNGHRDRSPHSLGRMMLVGSRRPQPMPIARSVVLGIELSASKTPMRSALLLSARGLTRNPDVRHKLWPSMRTVLRWSVDNERRLINFTSSANTFAQNSASALPCMACYTSAALSRVGSAAMVFRDPGPH